MYKNIIVDGHCDTLQRAFDENLSIFNTKFDFNMTNAEFVKPYIQFLASFINTKYLIYIPDYHNWKRQNEGARNKIFIFGNTDKKVKFWYNYKRRKGKYDNTICRRVYTI